MIEQLHARGLPAQGGCGFGRRRWIAARVGGRVPV